MLKQTFPESEEFFDTWNEKSANIQRIHLRMGNSVKVHMSGYYSDFQDLRGEYGKTGAGLTTVDKSAIHLQKARMLAAELSRPESNKKIELKGPDGFSVPVQTINYGTSKEDFTQDFKDKTALMQSSGALLSLLTVIFNCDGNFDHLSPTPK